MQNRTMDGGRQGSGASTTSITALSLPSGCEAARVPGHPVQEEDPDLHGEGRKEGRKEMSKTAETSYASPFPFSPVSPCHHDLFADLAVACTRGSRLVSATVGVGRMSIFECAAQAEQWLRRESKIIG